jgi:cytochrome c peroxidase
MYRLILLLLIFITVPIRAIEPIRPLPQQLSDITLEKAKLGRTLFLDTILSSDQTVSCSSCHSFEHGGADPRDVSLGVNGRPGIMQSPTVYNSRYNFKQFWNGRASNLHEQTSGPLMAHVEMNMSPETIEMRINQSDYYREAFAALYGEGKVTFNNIVDAIVEFEKALVTPNSRFDRYLRGELTLTKDEQMGYAKFKSLGCVTCHNGINVGANTFQKMGLIREYPYDPKYLDRYAVTKKEYHKNVYKVPTLRNITLTAPYFHNAKAKDLDDAIYTMGYYNLGIKISRQDITLLHKFLETLEGERPAILDMP